MSERYDGTVTWMGRTVTVEFLRQLAGDGLNPWLTIISGTPVPRMTTTPTETKEQK